MVEEGVNGALFAERFGLPAGDAFSGWDELVSEGLVTRRGQDFKLTEKGLLFLNEILLRLLPKAS
jgi:coproporphyrinogen III oxidase-like Fe-S oxidoreductase